MTAGENDDPSAGANDDRAALAAVAHAEMRTALALLTATWQSMTGHMTAEQYIAFVTEAVDEQYADPRQVIPSLSYVALRALTVLSQTTGAPVDELLRRLGEEAALGG